MSATRREFLIEASLVAVAPLVSCRGSGSAIVQPHQREPKMPIQFSDVIRTQSKAIGSTLSVDSLELANQRSSPVMVMDDFRASGPTFGPHPHAGFSAITYVFQDSEGSLRNRDSLGNHVVVGPGGICWLQAASGAQHEEIPADEKELRGLQLFVNLSANKKLSKPKGFSLTSEQVPEWRGPGGDRVRVVVGSFAERASPLQPTEPFTLLDIDLHRSITYTLEEGHTAIVYARTGSVVVRSDTRQQGLSSGQALALFGGAGPLRVEASSRASVLLLSGRELHEPVVMTGPFIMNERSQIDAAIARYQSGQMGELAPFAKG